MTAGGQFDFRRGLTFAGDNGLLAVCNQEK
jgi:hypothetical protein